MREMGLRIFGMTIVQCILKATHIYAGSAVTQSHVADFDFLGTTLGRDLTSLDRYNVFATLGTACARGGWVRIPPAKEEKEGEAQALHPLFAEAYFNTF